jgi:hypothetical protein
MEDCLTLYPAQRDELEPLLSMVARLQSARTLQALPEFRRTSAIRVRNLIESRPRSAARTAPTRHSERSEESPTERSSLP